MAFHLNGYSNFHDDNQDWIVSKIKSIEDTEAHTEDLAEAAQASAEASQLSAEAAQTSAEASQQSAENAAESEANAAQSAIDAADTVENTLNQINLLQSRVDNIIPSGTQTEGNTELLDIRVGANGIIYPSAGDAVRGQYNELNNDINTINVGDYAFKLIPDTYINSATGEQQTYSGWSASDFVPLTKSRYTKITCAATIAYSVVYDENKTRIALFPLAAGDNYLTAENGAYIRFSDITANAEKVKVRLVNIDQSLTVPYIGGDAKVIGDLFKRVIMTHNSTTYVSTLSAFTSDSTDDFNKIDRSCFIPVVNLNSANKPAEFSQGFVLCVKSATGTDGLYQALYNTYGKLTHYRAKWTYGSDWGAFISVDSSAADTLNYAEAFRTVSVIGDSITIGYMPNVGGTGGVTNTDYAWQNYVFTNANITTCAKGGASAKTFFTNAEMNTALNNLPTNSQCVVIYLGTNPVKDDNDAELPYGTESDVVESYNATPTETWVGYYTKLIKTVQHNLPNTPIIVIGLAIITERNACIELSANACNALYVSAAIFNNNDWNIADNNDFWHCTAIGYIGRARVMRKAINYVISQNLEKFNAIQTIS